MATLEELDTLLEEIDKLEKRGNWTEERHEVLKNLTGAEPEKNPWKSQLLDSGGVRKPVL